jgi:hypothetical protein
MRARVAARRDLRWRCHSDASHEHRRHCGDRKGDRACACTPKERPRSHCPLSTLAPRLPASPRIVGVPSSSSMDVPVLSHGVLEADDDIARGASRSVCRAALWHGDVRRRGIRAAPHARITPSILCWCECRLSRRERDHGRSLLRRRDCCGCGRAVQQQRVLTCRCRTPCLTPQHHRHHAARLTCVYPRCWATHCAAWPCWAVARACLGRSAACTAAP